MTSFLIIHFSNAQKDQHFDSLFNNTLFQSVMQMILCTQTETKKGYNGTRRARNKIQLYPFYDPVLRFKRIRSLIDPLDFFKLVTTDVPNEEALNGIGVHPGVRRARIP